MWPVYRRSVSQLAQPQCALLQSSQVFKSCQVKSNQVQHDHSRQHAQEHVTCTVVHPVQCRSQVKSSPGSSQVNVPGVIARTSRFPDSQSSPAMAHARALQLKVKSNLSECSAWRSRESRGRVRPQDAMLGRGLGRRCAAPSVRQVATPTATKASDRSASGRELRRCQGVRGTGIRGGATHSNAGGELSARPLMGRTWSALGWRMGSGVHEQSGSWDRGG